MLPPLCWHLRYMFSLPWEVHLLISQAHPKGHLLGENPLIHRF